MIIAVAGTGGGTGRTVTALGLASAAAAEGHNTVLIDGDHYQHDAAAAARGVTALAEMLGHTPPLQVLPLGWQETVRWAGGQGPAEQISILDLPCTNQEDVLAIAQAVVIPLPEGDRKLLPTLFPTRFKMVAAENGAPCFALVHSVRRPAGASPRTTAYDDALEDTLVEPLSTRIPYSILVREIAADTPWGGDWAAFASLFAPAWAELRDRLALPRPAGTDHG
ncbi:hypothetical protein [Streptomyces sp. NPDC001404]|uniref:nucleotide-binding protein n=1 Tax=Streptomyces sp. NPDC001404 TaxID=3364571 RepID=UPI0036A5DD1C